MHRRLRTQPLCAVFLLLLLSTGAAAQSVRKSTWTIDSGLPQNSVHALLQTHDGAVWIATEAGLVRFNGTEMRRFTMSSDPALPNDDLSSLAEGADGALWIGSAGGLIRYDSGRFRLLGASAITDVVVDAAGAVFALSGDELMRAGRDSLQAVALPGGGSVAAIARGRQGDLLAAAGTSLYRLQSDHFQRARELPEAPLAIAEGADGAAWMTSRSAVLRLGGDAGTRRWQLGSELPGTRLNALRLTSAGAFAGTNQGAFELRVSPGARVVAVAEMRGEAVLTALADAEGNRWFGTDSSGLVMLAQLPVGSVPGLDSEAVTSVVSFGGGAAIGTRDSGVRMLQGASVSTAAWNSRLSSSVVLAVAAGTKGDLWVGTPEGLDHVFANGQVAHLSSADGLPDDLVRSLLAEADGTLWVGGRRGVARLLQGRVAEVLTRAEGLPDDVVGSMLRDHAGTLWIGTKGGLAAQTGGLLRSIALPGGPHGVTSLLELGDGLIIGTRDAGLMVLRGSAVQVVHAVGAVPEVDALVDDGAGSIWLRSPRGVSRMAANALTACAVRNACDVDARLYGAADGVPSNDSSLDGHPAAARLADGRLVFATRRGLAALTPGGLRVSDAAPPVEIGSFTVDGQPIPVTGEAQVGPGHRRFAVGFSAVAFAAPSEIRYRFRLDGFDREWFDAGTRHSAEYTNLPGGRYRFLVIAVTPGGAQSAAAELRFQVAAPFYRRPWVYLLALALLAALAYALYRGRLVRMEREFAVTLKERNRIAREIHDTLAQDFVAVSLQLDLTAQLLKTDAADAAREQVEATRLLVQDGIRDARQSIWDLRAETSAATLPARLRAIAARTHCPSAAIEVSIDGAYREIDSKVEGEVLRVAKEAVGNAVRHANAAHIRLALIYSEDALLLHVRDDGDGFVAAEVKARRGRYGLAGMGERAAAIGAKFDVQSAPGQGTSVSLKVQYSAAGGRGRRGWRRKSG